MTTVLDRADTHVASATSGKVFITRHGERADLADEHWLAQAEVSLGAHLLWLTVVLDSCVCVQVADDPPLTQQGIQQAYELGLRLQVLCCCLQPFVQRSDSYPRLLSTQGENIRQIYSSPFLRTVQTAQQVANCLKGDVTICVEDGLAEGMLTRTLFQILNTYSLLVQACMLSAC